MNLPGQSMTPSRLDALVMGYVRACVRFPAFAASARDAAARRGDREGVKLWSDRLDQWAALVARVRPFTSAGITRLGASERARALLELEAAHGMIERWAP